MKRRLVMNLYHPIPQEEPTGEWLSVKDKLPDCKSGLFQVKLENGDTSYAHYYADGVAWKAYYGEQTLRWWHTNIDEAMLDVTHYRQVS